MKNYRIVTIFVFMVMALAVQLSAAGTVSRPTAVREVPEYLAAFPTAITGITHAAVTCRNLTKAKPFQFISKSPLIWWTGAVDTTPTTNGATPVGFLLPASTASPIICPMGTGKNRLCLRKDSGATGAAVAYAYLLVYDTYPGCTT